MATAKIIDLPEGMNDAEIQKQLRMHQPVLISKFERSSDRTRAVFEYEVLRPKLAQEKLMDSAYFFQGEFSWRSIAR
ncbi:MULTISPECIES: hypothetical protein [unclassified Pseudomonas]|uniref:hypothetical protein n=1 Tax=unclassified Pseudomonas TaxID=196821 RepID=UPI000A1DC5A0|nr:MULTISPECIES: hypothetical protein [unclassified Pseudomonas]AWA39395.1 hypothetical protein DBV33_12640 [Pseudomonas fluorescens]NKF28373.1 hypothetical protein [Pseudomonas sp. BG5]